MEFCVSPYCLHLAGCNIVVGKSEGNSSFYWASEIISLYRLVAESEAQLASSIWVFLVKLRSILKFLSVCLISRILYSP